MREIKLNSDLDKRNKFLFNYLIIAYMSLDFL